MTAYGSAAQVITAFLAGDELATRPTKAAGDVSRLAAVTVLDEWRDLQSYGDMIACYLLAPLGWRSAGTAVFISVKPSRAEYHSITTRKHIAALHAALTAAGYVPNADRTEWRKA